MCWYVGDTYGEKGFTLSILVNLFDANDDIYVCVYKPLIMMSYWQGLSLLYFFFIIRFNLLILELVCGFDIAIIFLIYGPLHRGKCTV